VHQTTRPAGDGGSEITLKLTAREIEMLGDDATDAVGLLARALWAAADLRAGTGRDAWWPVVMDVSRLIRQMEGVRDAAVREMPDASHGELAAALDLHRQTVASRRRAGTLPPAEPTEWEQWARTGSHPDQPQH